GFLEFPSQPLQLILDQERHDMGEMHRSEEHTSELSHPSISYAVFCLKKKRRAPNESTSSTEGDRDAAELPAKQPARFVAHVAGSERVTPIAQNGLAFFFFFLQDAVTHNLPPSPQDRPSLA